MICYCLQSSNFSPNEFAIFKPTVANTESTYSFPIQYRRRVDSEAQLIISPEKREVVQNKLMAFSIVIVVDVQNKSYKFFAKT